MIKCFRCDQEITNLEDIGKISRAKREYYMGTDICFCKKCTNELPQLMDADLTEWYQLVNVTETVCGIKENVSRLPERVIEKKPVLSDAEIEMIESEGTLRELEDEGAFSDEGIMPGCHSYFSVYEDQGIVWHFKCLKEIGSCVSYLRDIYDFTTEDLAKKLCIPEYVIVNIENGEEDYWNKHDDEEIRNFIKGFFKRMVVTEYDKRNLFF